MESVIKSVSQRKLVNSGFLYGPFCPIYGFGATIMFLFLDNFKDNIILLFIIGFFILSLWEYIVGWALEKLFHAKYWDYSDNKFNIKGRVCLENSIFWGLLGVVFTKYIHPFIVDKVDIIETNYLIFLTAILLIIMIVDAIISTIKVRHINLNLEKLKEITNTIKEKIDELDAKQTKSTNKESLQQAIDELKNKQAKMKRNLLRQTNRLKKAFPTMKSDTMEKMSDFLKEKKENIRSKK